MVPRAGSGASLAMTSFTLSGCRAVITGASSGLGAEFARQLAPRASALMLVARGEAALEAVRAECARVNAALRVELCAADLADEQGRGEVERRLAESRFGPDLLINNAGMGDYGSLATADPAKLRLMLNLNMTAPVLLTRALLPLLRRPGGILNVSSLAGELPMPDTACYAASKAFMTRFSLALSVELEAEGVAVACVCPGPTPTGFSKAARRPDGTDTDRAGQGVLRQPPEAVVAAALRTLENGGPLVFPGAGVKAAACLFRHLPRFVLHRLLRARHARAKVSAAPPPPK